MEDGCSLAAAELCSAVAWQCTRSHFGCSALPVVIVWGELVTALRFTTGIS
jgi:hypothetical protein